MNKEKLKIETKAHYGKNNIKIIDLQNSRYFFEGLHVLAYKWKYKNFFDLLKLKDTDLQWNVFTIFIAVIYYNMCVPKGWRINSKRFKNNLLLKNKYSILFRFDGEIQEVSEHYFDDAVKWLKEKGLIQNSSAHYTYIELGQRFWDYSRKLGNYLFNTGYAQKSIKENTHYFGSLHSELKEEKAYTERKLIRTERLH